MTSIIDKDNVYTNFKHFVVDTRSFQIEKARNVEMYDKLRIYIQKQNEKRQQEMEMSAELKRAKREKELKHKRDKSTLDEIREEIAQQEKQLQELKLEKDRLFAAFKKVLTEDEARKNMQRAREAAFNNITFSTPNSADLPKPYQSAIVTVANTSLAPSVVTSQPGITSAPPPPPTLSLNSQQLFYPPHLQSNHPQHGTPTKSSQQSSISASPNSHVPNRRDPTPQSHLTAPSHAKSMLLSQQSHLQPPSQSPQTQPLMLSKQTTHHPSLSLHAQGFPGMIPHPQALSQQSPQSFGSQNIPERGRVSITGKRTHEQSQNVPSIAQQQASQQQQQQQQILSGANSFLPRGGPPPPQSILPPGALHPHPNGQALSAAHVAAIEQYHQYFGYGLPNSLSYLTNPNLPK